MVSKWRSYAILYNTKICFLGPTTEINNQSCHNIIKNNILIHIPHPYCPSPIIINLLKYLTSLGAMFF